jgi:hypothetical protein
MNLNINAPGFLVINRNFLSVTCVANWQKFRPQNAKVAAKKYQRSENSAAEFWQIFKKWPKSGQTFLSVLIT